MKTGSCLRLVSAVGALGLFMLAACGAQAQVTPAPAAGTSKVGLTIYSTADPMGFDAQQFISQQRLGYNPQYASQVPGFGVIRDERDLDLKQGVNFVPFTDVAEFIDPTTVSLTDLSVPPESVDEKGLKVVEQKFAFDLVSPQKLFDKFIDKPATVYVNAGQGPREAVSGTLLSNNQGQLVLKTATGLRVLGATNDVQLGELPEGLITKPTLQWQLFAPAAGKRHVRTSYQTDGITWRADYNLVLNGDETKADLGAWVTILNLTGARYPDASLKLIAGDVQRFKPQVAMARRGMMAGARMADESMAAPAGFEEKSFFEYHMYTLGRPTTVDQNSTQQIALFDAKRGINVEKVLVYYGLPGSQYWVFPDPQQDRNLGQQTNKKVDVYIRFDNKEVNKLGIPLPKGKMRVFKVDAPGSPTTQPSPAGAPGAGAAEASGVRQMTTGDGSLEFVGEDLLDHTPRNAQVLVKIGQSFDVTGERKQMDFNANYNGHVITETIRITLHNAKNQPQKVVVRETLYRWVNWEITNKSDPFEKMDSRTIHFEVTVPASGDKTVDYTVKYTW